MGQNICDVAVEESDAELVSILEAPGHPDVSKVFYSLKVSSDKAEALEKADVVIDFSSPDSTMNLLSAAVKEGKAMVVGTTGFSDRQLGKIEKAAEDIPLLLSPNMSIGVNVLFKAAAVINEALKKMGYDREIVESHHSRKVDSPSGTAKKLFSVIAGEKDKAVYGREGAAGPRKKNEIGVHAIRGGSIVGEHTLMWAGKEDRIELTHRASSRKIFARGAVKAALWLAQAGRGRLYKMEDVLS